MKLQFKLSHARTVLVLLLAVLSYYGAWAEELGGYNFDTEGTGTDKVYLIKTETDLENLAAYVNAGNDCKDLTFKLHNGITMTAVAAGQSNHTAIGTSDRQFRGTFDGAGNTITGLTINQPNADCQGLFGVIGTHSIVKKVTLAGCHITGKANVGGIAGRAEGQTNLSTSKIEECHVNGTIAATASGADCHGGIAGFAADAYINSCTMQGTISTSQSCDNYGGIVGWANSHNYISNCENAASITGDGANHGGIVGNDEYSNQFRNCLNTGTVEGSSSIGGIAGYYSDSDVYYECYYASPCNVKALDGNESSLTKGHAERAYAVLAGSHIASIESTPTPSATSAITGTKYYTSGNWTLTMTLNQNNETFVSYSCEGGTLTELTTAGGTHTLTVSDQDVTIGAFVSSNSGTDIGGATIADIDDQRWKGSAPVEPTVTVTYGTETLTLGTDYIVEYTNNSNISQGIATVIVKGVNNYRLTTSKTFNIVDFPLQNPQAENSEDNPYLIASETDLQALSSIVNTGARRDGFYKQTIPITLTKEHTAIGTFSQGFTGTYDGGSNAISGLHINQPNSDYQGLFGYISDATIKYVVVDGCDITGRHYVGGVVGQSYGGIIDYCVVSGAIKPSTKSTHGGIVGEVRGKVHHCFSAATVEGSSYVGSIVGVKSNLYYDFEDNYHLPTCIGGVGVSGVSTGTDEEGAEVVVKISAGDGVTITYPATPTYVWNNEDYYKSGTAVTLTCTVPTGGVFDHYAVSSGEISNAGTIDGSHVLTGFTGNVVISRTYVDNLIDLTDGQGAIATIADLTFNGQTQQPLPVVTYDNVTLVNETDYTVSYSEGCVNADTYTVTVTGVGHYTGTLQQTFTIKPLDISTDNAVTVAGIDAEYGQTGSAVHPTPLAVTCAAAGNATLVDGTDYDLSYTGDCIQPGNYNVVLTGTGNYKGTKNIGFTILENHGLTIHNGMVTNEYMPVMGSFGDYYQKNEFVIPAAELAAMDEMPVTSMRFYLQTKATKVWTGTFKVFMKEVDFTSISEYSGTTGATTVYEGSLDGTGNVMAINFTTPYVYHGGNLLVGIYQTVKGDDSRAVFYGEEVTGASISGRNSSDINSSYVSQRDFLPKTTFLYDVDIDGFTVSGINQSYSYTGESVNVSYSLSDANGHSLVEGTHYTVELKRNNVAVAEVNEVGDYTYTFTGISGSGYTGSKSINFAVSLPASPTGLIQTDYSAGNVTLSWTRGSVESSWILQFSTSRDFATYTECPPCTTSSITIENLPDNMTYYARVKAVIGTEESAWSSIGVFRTAEKKCIGLGGTETSCNAPFTNRREYSFLQQIYTADEMGGDAGYIYSIEFFNASSGNVERNLDIYLTETPQDRFGVHSGTRYEWVEASDADLVFSGTVNFPGNSWGTITFDRPFLYSGTKNLGITIDDNTGQKGVDDIYFRIYSPANAGNYPLAYNTYANYNPTTIWGADRQTRYARKNQIRMQFEQTMTLADAATDNSTIVATNDDKQKTVSLKDRKLYTDEEWNTICLPFDVDLTDENSPLYGAEAKTLTDAVIDGTHVTLTFGNPDSTTEPVTTLKAGTPYIIKWVSADLLINSTADWNAFAEAVDGGNTFAGKIVKLGNDITVSQKVGTWVGKNEEGNRLFSGTFDGNGHTLTLALNNGNIQGYAPFSAVQGATIKNVKTTGTVTLTAKESYHASGLVGFANGVTILNCHVNADIRFPSGAGDVHSGGIIGHALSAPFTMTECLFDGSFGFVSGASGTLSKMGALVGWHDASTPNITRCLNAGTFTNCGNVAKIARVGGNGNISQCYSTVNLNSNGKQADNRGEYTTATGSALKTLLGSGWLVKDNEVVPEFPIYINTPIFTGVTIDKTDRSISKDGGKVQFIGYYDAFDITDADENIYYMTAGGTLKHTGVARTLNACRAYFLFSENPGAREFVLNFGEEETTAIAEMRKENVEMRNGAWYTVNGVRLSGKPTKKGLYIHNGRKETIK